MYTSLMTASRLIAIWLLFVGVAQAQDWDLTKLSTVLEEHVKKSKLPAMGVALVTSEGIKYLEVAGIRKKGAEERVTKEDLWHLGSCGKAITATMIARLVEAKKIRWDQTLAETFPDSAEEMGESFGEVTLQMLLCHKSGIEPNFNIADYLEDKDMPAARLKVLREAIKQPRKSKPGTFIYSNWGYTIAATMAEKATGEAWETLVREEVFEPLGLKSAGFGGTGTIGSIDQPWPHGANGRPMESNGPAMDNIPVMGPAGTIHMSLSDWCTFVGEHLKGRKGKSSYLKSETFSYLQTSEDDPYSFGWVKAERSWGGHVLNHSGDNTMNHAVVWLAPEKDFAVLVVTNQTRAQGACDAAAAGLILSWTKKKSGN